MISALRRLAARVSEVLSLRGNFRQVPGASLCRFSILVFASAMGGCYDASKYRPGGSQFPEVTPQPNHTFVLRGSLDPTLPVEFDAIYGATETHCMYHSLGSYIEGAGVLAPDALFPIDIRVDGDHYSGTVPIDGVYPGRCGWRFRGVVMRAVGEDIFHGGIAATGGWVVEAGWHTYPGQPSANPPPMSWQCSVQHELAGTAVKREQSLLCWPIPHTFRPQATVSDETTLVEVNLVQSK